MSNDFLGLDRSGNDNNWTVNNMTLADQMVDSPTNNFATINPLVKTIVGTLTLSEGNLRASASSNTGYAESTIAITSGKYYMEVYCETLATADADGIGFTDLPGGGAGTNDQNSGIYYRSNGTFYVDASIENTYATFETGDIIGMAINADDGAVYFYKNNVLIASRTSLSYDKYLPYLYNRVGNGSGTALVANFGQDSSFAGNKTAQGNQDGNSIGDFYYTPPTGFLALCTSNLPDVAVTPSEHFNTVLYTGNGSTQSITGFGFQPDWIWDKSRNQANSHMLVDAVRGVGKYLRTNLTNAEVDDASVLTSFDSDGVTVGDINGNATSSSSVMWGWKANGSGSSNTNGDITSTVSANVDAGFSIVSFTGSGSLQTVGHGLSKTPEFIIQKTRSIDYNWSVQHHEMMTSSTGKLFLNSTAGIAASSTPYMFNATSSLFTTVWSDANVTTIAYCFHSVDGYSKFGSYTGNGSTDGTFVYTGFRPAWVMVKDTSAGGGSWGIYDSKRSPNNVMSERLVASASQAEATNTSAYDFTSNGFKIRTSDSNFNTNNTTFIYLAFSETPFKYSNAR